jgi:hypothetical protein
MSIFQSPEGKPECPECASIKKSISSRLSGISIYDYKDFLSRKAFKWLDFYECSLRSQVFKAYKDNDFCRLKNLEDEVDQFFAFLGSFWHIMEEGKIAKENEGKPSDTTLPFSCLSSKLGKYKNYKK